MKHPTLAPVSPRLEGQAAYLDAIAAQLISHGISQADWGRRAGINPSNMPRLRESAARDRVTRKQLDRLTDAANNLLAEHGDPARYAYTVRTIGWRQG